MNWGWKIVFAFSLFGVFIGYMVFRSFQVTIDLVADDYYQQELAYQQRIDRLENSRTLAQPLTFSQQAKHLVVQFPADLTERVQGEIQLFRPSDARGDQAFAIALDSQWQQVIATDQLARGHYKIRVDWTSGQEAYYTEESIFIR